MNDLVRDRLRPPWTRISMLSVSVCCVILHDGNDYYNDSMAADI